MLKSFSASAWGMRSVTHGGTAQTVAMGGQPFITLDVPNNVFKRGSLSAVNDWFAVNYKSYHRIITTTATLKAREFGTAEIVPNDTIRINASKILNGTMLIVNETAYQTGEYANFLPQNSDSSWEIALTPQDLWLVNEGDNAIFFTHTNGDWIPGISFTIKLKAVPVEDNTIDYPDIQIDHPELTNYDKTVTLAFNEPAKPTEATDWEGVGTPYNSDFYIKLQKPYNQDITDTVEFQDTVGNTVKVPINIDKTPPTAPLTPNSTNWTNANRLWMPLSTK